MMLWLCGVVALLVAPQGIMASSKTHGPVHANDIRQNAHRAHDAPLCPDGTAPPLGWLPLGCSDHSSLCASVRDILDPMHARVPGTHDHAASVATFEPLHRMYNTVCGPNPGFTVDRARDKSRNATAASNDEGHSPTQQNATSMPTNDDVDTLRFDMNQHGQARGSVIRARREEEPDEPSHPADQNEPEEPEEPEEPDAPKVPVLPRNDEGNFVKLQCELSTFLDGECTAKPNETQHNTIFTLTAEKDKRVCPRTHSCGADCFSSTTFVHELTVVGELPPHQLHCLLQELLWSNVVSLKLNTLRSSIFSLEALRSMQQLLELDLSMNGLTLLDAPAELLFPNLTSLYLQGNRLREIPQQLLDNLRSLQKLDVSNNLIEELSSKNFHNNPNLRTLSFSRNRLNTLRAGVFDPLDYLEELDLERNELTTLEEGIFVSLTALRSLDIGQNPLNKIPPNLLQYQTSLETFMAANIWLDAIPDGLFSSTTALTYLSLASNDLAYIECQHLQPLTALQRLDLSNNRLEELPTHLFHGLYSLEMIHLERNQLAALQPGLFQDQASLKMLSVYENCLEHLEADLLANATQLYHLDVTSNRLSQFPLTLFTNVTSLRQLFAGNNMLTRFGAHAPHLNELFLNNNPIEELGGISSLTNLVTLVLTNHRLNEVRLSGILPLKNLTTLRIAAHPDNSDAHIVFNKEDYNATTFDRIKAQMAKIETLDIGNVRINHDMEPFFNISSVSRLGFGWPGVEDNWPLHLIYTLLVPDTVQQLAITHTRLTEIALPDNRTYDTVDLHGNAELTCAIVPQDVVRLNVSECTQLRDLTVPLVEILDISSTNIRGEHELCATLGTRMLFAQNLLNENLQSEGLVTQFLGRCLQSAQALDMSNNRWLKHLDTIRRATSRVTVLSGRKVNTVVGDTLEERETLPAFSTHNNPITCQLELVNTQVQFEGSIGTGSELAYRFECVCTAGYSLHGSTCEADELPVIEIVVGSLLGLLALQGIIYGAVRWYKSRVVTLRKDHALKEQLLSERDAEVLALKAGWEIDYDQLHFLQQVAAGACGDVWKSEWDELIVAVKVLKQSMRMFDETTIAEFEKEVEFLQRTRHPHLVRFFGAGTAPNGCPFLVLEYVSLGSLQALLQRDLEQVIKDCENKRTSVTQDILEADFGVEDHKELVVVTPHVANYDDASSLTVSGLKQRLARDIACGMAFIHSLGQFHRDLKSGNVLVSGKLRAKLTDFGTIRQRLSAETPRDEPAQGGVRYWQRLRTTTISMTATVGVGTPLYMAPEVLMGHAYGAKADVFSFGVLLWEIAMQQVPALIAQEEPGFQGATMIKLSRLLQSGKRLVFSKECENEVGSWYQQLTAECMAHEPTERPSFEELMRRLGDA